MPSRFEVTLLHVWSIKCLLISNKPQDRGVGGLPQDCLSLVFVYSIACLVWSAGQETIIIIIIR